MIGPDRLGDWWSIDMMARVIGGNVPAAIRHTLNRMNSEPGGLGGPTHGGGEASAHGRK